VSGLYTIPAQPNEYRGEWYDSLTERRVAILLTALDIPYTAHRIVIKRNGRKTTPHNLVANPDFELYTLGLYLDVKPNADMVWDAESKWQEAARESKKPVITWGGQPRDDDLLLWAWLPNGRDAPVWFARCPNCGSIAVIAVDLPAAHQWTRERVAQLLARRNDRPLGSFTDDELDDAIWLGIEACRQLATHYESEVDPTLRQWAEVIREDGPVPDVWWWSECHCLCDLMWEWDDIGWATERLPWRQS
jgi:hypothetical protein